MFTRICYHSSDFPVHLIGDIEVYELLPELPSKAVGPLPLAALLGSVDAWPPQEGGAAVKDFEA